MTILSLTELYFPKIGSAVFLALFILAILTCSPAAAQTLPPAITVINYDDGSIVDMNVSLELYVKRVLWKEWFTTWDEDALKAGAVAIRTWASCPENWRGRDPYGNPQVYGDAHGQVYEAGGENIASVSAAVDATAGQFLSYNDAVINAQYRNENGEYTNPCAWYGAAYLVSIYDPISADATPTLDRCLLAGMGQYGSQRWAIGNSSSSGGGTPFPQWDYPQILAHYYSSVDFEGIYFPRDYRFNVLSTQTPASIPQGYATTTSVLVQNTGTNTWYFPSDCSESDPSGIALGMHWYNSSGGAVEFAGVRHMICNTASLAPGSHLEIQAPIDPAADGIGAGDYQLTWDIYFNSMNMWASRLDEYGNLYDPLWETYSDEVAVYHSGGPTPTTTPGFDFGPPRNVRANTGQSPGVWTMNNSIIVVWEPPEVGSDITIAGYAYEWDNEPNTIVPVRIDTEYRGMETVLSSGGEQYFHVRGIATDGRSGAVAHLGPFQIDTAPPTNPTFKTSTSHVLDEWSTSRVVDVAWAGASDGNGSGIAGYSVLWDQSAYSFPNSIVDTTTSYDSSPQLADGLYYFHLRTVDNMGLVSSSALDFGPFKIDGTPPQLPAQLNSPSHAVNVWSSNTVVQAMWSAASDGTGSGIAGYSMEWNAAADTLPDKAVDTLALEAYSPALTDGKNYYFHVRSIDAAGYGSISAAHLGPFWIDSTPPQVPTQFTSSSHTTRSWSNENVVQVSWNAASDGAGSGVAGYSILWDRTAGTAPDAVVETTGVQAASSPLPDGANHYAHLRSVDGVNFASAETAHLGPFWIDTAPPTARVLPLYDYVTSTQFLVEWQGEDALSGVRNYDIEYRVENKNWQSWLSNVTSDSATFTGVADQIYEFRARARDVAGNLSTWQSDTADTKTQVRVDPYLAVIPLQMMVLSPLTDSAPIYRHIAIRNEGGGELQWTTTSDADWLTVSPTVGLETTMTTATINSEPLPLGIYTAHLTISGTTETRRSPQLVTTTLRVVEKVYETYLPLVMK